MSESNENTLGTEGQAPHRPLLLRALGPGTAVAIVVGNVIGSGIFYKPGTIAAEAGDFRMIVVAWITGGIVCVLGALCFAELAVMLPQAGGIYVYLREAFGRPTAFLFGWSEFLFNRPASTGALAVAFIGSLSIAMDWRLTSLQGLPLALGLIALMAWVNVMGVIWGGRVQSATTLAKAGFLGLIGAAPFILAAIGLAQVDFGNYQTTMTPREPDFTTRFGVVLLAVMWAYNGWHGIAPVAEEIRDPQKNIPRALFGGVGILVGLYLLANFSYHAILPMEKMAEAGKHASEAAVRELLGPAGAIAIGAIIMCSTLGTINSNLLISPRVPFAMGRDGLLFKPFGWVHSNYRTPAAAIIIQAVMAGVLVFASGVLVEMGSVSTNTTIFDMLTDFVIFGASIFYVLAVVSVIVLRRKHPEWSRPYRTWGYPVVPALFLLFYAWFLWQVYAGKPFEAKAGLLLIAAGLPVYFFCFRNRSAAHSDQPPFHQMQE